VLVRLDHVARFIVNADHGVVRAAVKVAAKGDFSCRIYSRSPFWWLFHVVWAVTSGWLPALFYEGVSRNYGPQPLFDAVLFRSDCEHPPVRRGADLHRRAYSMFTAPG
jgi:hypothetical protein